VGTCLPDNTRCDAKYKRGSITNIKQCKQKDSTEYYVIGVVLGVGVLGAGAGLLLHFHRRKKMMVEGGRETEKLINK